MPSVGFLNDCGTFGKISERPHVNITHTHTHFFSSFHQLTLMSPEKTESLVPLVVPSLHSGCYSPGPRTLGSLFLDSVSNLYLVNTHTELHVGLHTSSKP